MPQQATVLQTGRAAQGVPYAHQLYHQRGRGRRRALVAADTDGRHAAANRPKSAIWRFGAPAATQPVLRGGDAPRFRGRALESRANCRGMLNSLRWRQNAGWACPSLRTGRNRFPATPCQHSQDRRPSQHRYQRGAIGWWRGLIVALLWKLRQDAFAQQLVQAPLNKVLSYGRALPTIDAIRRKPVKTGDGLWRQCHRYLDRWFVIFTLGHRPKITAEGLQLESI